MPGGTDSLERLFAAKDLPLVPGLNEVEYRNDSIRFRRDLRITLNTLNSPAPKEFIPGSLEEAMYQIFPIMDIENCAKAPVVTNHHDPRTPYVSGYGNAMELFRNSGRTGESPNKADVIYTTAAKLSVDEDLKAARTVLKGAGLIPDPVSSLEQYLDVAESKVAAAFVEAKDDQLTAKVFFRHAPQFGLSLVAFGDALVRIATEIDTQRTHEYAELAKRAYQSSGFKNTSYVKSQLLKIGQLPERAYGILPLSMMTPAQLKYLGIQTPQKA